jgi:hypothetical protein
LPSRAIQALFITVITLLFGIAPLIVVHDFQRAATFIVSCAEAAMADSLAGKVNTALTGCSRNVRRIGTVWLVQADGTADLLRDHVVQRVPDCKTLLVVRAAGDAAWAEVDPVDADWLLAQL